MARTIFGIFALWLNQKRELDFMVNRIPSSNLNSTELNILATQYGVSHKVVDIAYDMWRVVKPSKNLIQNICAKVLRLNTTDKVFLYNSCVVPHDMIFQNNDHNIKICCGDKQNLIKKESIKIGVYSISDDYFIYDKDFGLMSFNEIRNSELSMAIQDWFDVEK